MNKKIGIGPPPLLRQCPNRGLFRKGFINCKKIKFDWKLEYQSLWHCVERDCRLSKKNLIKLSRSRQSSQLCDFTFLNIKTSPQITKFSVEKLGRTFCFYLRLKTIPTPILGGTYQDQVIIYAQCFQRILSRLSLTQLSVSS